MALGERKCRLRRSIIVILEFSPGESVSWWVTPWKATTTLCGSVGAVKVKLKSMCHLESFVALNLYAVFQVWNDSFVSISETQSGMPLSKPRAYPIQSHETSQNCSLLPISCHLLKLNSDFRLSIWKKYISYMFYTYTCPYFSTLHPSFVPPFFWTKKAQGAMAKYVRSKVPMEGAPHLRSCPWEVGGLVNLWEENHAGSGHLFPHPFRYWVI